MQEIVPIIRVAKGEACEFCVKSISACSKYCVSGIFAPVGLVIRVKIEGASKFLLGNSCPFLEGGRNVPRGAVRIGSFAFLPMLLNLFEVYTFEADLQFQLPRLAQVVV